MSTNAPTSRRITYMHCHVGKVSLEVFFFSKKYFNRKFPIFFKKKIFFPIFFFQTPLCSLFCFTLWILFQFVFLLTLYFQSSSNLSSLCTFFFHINGTIVEKLDLNFFKELFWSLGILQPNLRNLTWILSIFFFHF